MFSPGFFKFLLGFTAIIVVGFVVLTMLQVA
jgi:hypothetical protein